MEVAPPRRQPPRTAAYLAEKTFFTFSDLRAPPKNSSKGKRKFFCSAPRYARAAGYLFSLGHGGIPPTPSNFCPLAFVNITLAYGGKSDKMKNMIQRKSGFSQIIFLIIIGLAILGGGAILYYQKSTKQIAPVQQIQESGIPLAGEQSTQAPPSAQQPPQFVQQPIQNGSVSPPPECIGKKATDLNLPESCKIWFSSQNLQSQSKSQPVQQQPQQQISEPLSQPTQQPQPSFQFGSQGVSVKSTGAKYIAVSSKPMSGWFKTGQEADTVLSAIDFNNAGGPLLFNHPGTVASDGVHLLLADRNNNRVLIWNKLPTGNTPPDLVLGQKNFITNNPGTGLDEMNWPVSVSIGGGKVAVTDTYNDRVLIWNNFPIQNGQVADLVINSAGFNAPPKRNINWPWGVWTDGKKLAITSTSGGSAVLIWNNFPTQNDQLADIYLKGQGAMGTPRTITSDGNHLIVGDHNAKVATQYEASFGGTSGQGNFFWKNWPTKDDESYDFFMSDPYDPRGAWMQGDFTKDGKLILLGVKLHIWNSFPENANDKPDISIGPFIGGDGSGAAATGGRLYLSLSNDNKIVGFSSLPTASGAKPNFAVGSPDIYTNTLDTNFIMSNPVPATDGESLFISSDFDRKLYVYKNLPDESGVHPDFVYSLPESPWDNELFSDTFILAGKRTVIIWKKLPKNGENPDLILQNSIGNVSFQELRGVAMDAKYFYLSDGMANKIYVWEGLPDKNSNPKFVITADQPGRLSSDGSYLADAATLSGRGGSVRIYRVSSLSSQSQPVTLGNGKFNLPQGALVSRNHLFVGDTGYNRALIWKNIEDAIAGENADIILGAETLNDINPEIGKNKLFWPATMAFDGGFLWLGEFKFSERLLRFSVK